MIHTELDEQKNRPGTRAGLTPSIDFYGGFKMDKRELSRCMKLNKTITLDLVNYMLHNKCKIYSGEAVHYACNILKRKATSHEVIGVLRNKSVFKKTSNYDKHSGALWVLDIWALPELLAKMEMEERFMANEEAAQMLNMFTNQVIGMLKKSLDDYDPRSEDTVGIVKKLKCFWDLVHLTNPEVFLEESLPKQ